MTDERHVLVIFPHPDDENLLICRHISKLYPKGIPVTYACLTLGQMGRNLVIPICNTRIITKYS